MKAASIAPGRAFSTYIIYVHIIYYFPDLWVSFIHLIYYKSFTEISVLIFGWSCFLGLDRCTKISVGRGDVTKNYARTFSPLLLHFRQPFMLFWHTISIPLVETWNIPSNDHNILCILLKQYINIYFQESF